MHGGQANSEGLTIAFSYMNILLNVVNEADDLVDTGSGAGTAAIIVVLLLLFAVWLAYKKS